MNPEFHIRKITEGLGYGDGSISAAQLRAEAGESAVIAAEEVINSPAILTPLDADDDGEPIDDDGCGDGRRVGRIFADFTQKAKSLNRAKVFGGGAAMTAAAEIGLGQTHGRNLQQTFSSAIKKLKARKLNFGAHTAENVANPAISSGCGAIDGAPEIVAAVPVYEKGIKAAVAALDQDDEGLGEVLVNFGAYAEEIKDQRYSGKEVVGEILDCGKVVKELAGPHKEAFIILNTVRGHTVNQQAVREAAGGRLDVFAVDVWRMEDYAEELYGDSAEQRGAFLSELVYTLATAGVLTRGDLPVYVIKTAPVTQIA